MRNYSWNDVEPFLEKELGKTKYIMTFGTIGSCNLEHDIDVIITKKPSVKTSDFYKEIHKIFDKLDFFLKKKYNAKLIRFAFSTEENLVTNFLGNKKKDLFIQTFIYNSYPQIHRDWDWVVFEDFDIDSDLKKADFILGSFEDLVSKEFNKKNYYDPTYLYLYLYDKICAGYSEKLLVETMNNYFDYLFRKRLGLKTPVAKNEKDVRRIFYQLCDEIDKLAKEKK